MVDMLRIIFSGITKSLGERASSDSLLTGVWGRFVFRRETD